VAESGHKILIVDDSKSLARYAEIVLEQAGLVPVVLTDSTLVMEYLNQIQPDIILLDLQMPGRSGKELAVEIREHDSFAHIPIIFLSAEQDIRKREEALNAGGDDFLEKPVKAEDLVNAVKAQIQSVRKGLSSP